MAPSNLYELMQQFNKENILFCYAGPMSQGIIEEIGSVLKNKMELMEAPLTLIKKIFIIFVEQVQNILNYSAERKIDEETNTEISVGIVVIGREEQNFFILCGNLIYKKDKNDLINYLEKIKKLDDNALKLLYKQVIREPKKSNSKGAGLGFIDISRKASKPIEYFMQDINDNYSFFSIKVIV